jgi:hypothetical protein
MRRKYEANRRVFEVVLLSVVAGLVYLLTQMGEQSPIVLHLFYLPVVLAGFYLGRYRAGILALLCVITVSLVVMADVGNYMPDTTPVLAGLLLAIWGAVLGLIALLVGTLSDERVTQLMELHDAHVGVVEILSRYLQCANPHLKARSSRVAELSQRVANQLRLSDSEVDNVRVASLLQDLENLEITARVIRKAVGELGGSSPSQQYTFQGTDLVQSLGCVLTGAFPLVALQGCMDYSATGNELPIGINAPFGARVIRTVRAFDRLMYGDDGGPQMTAAEAISQMLSDISQEHDVTVINALERVCAEPTGTATPALPISSEFVPLGHKF